MQCVLRLNIPEPMHQQALSSSFYMDTLLALVISDAIQKAIGVLGRSLVNVVAYRLANNSYH